jgi:invasion protein IalB
MTLDRTSTAFSTTLMIAALAFGVASARAETKGQPAPAAAPVGTEPQNTSAAYGDWTVRCQKVNDAAPRICELEQTLQMQNQQGQANPVAQIALGRPSAKEPLKLVVTLVPNVSFPSSVKLAVDDKDTQPVDLPWLRCLPGGCAAATEFKDDDAKRWKAQTATGRLIFKDGAGHEQSWPFSYRGFAQAMDGLSKVAP